MNLEERSVKLFLNGKTSLTSVNLTEYLTGKKFKHFSCVDDCMNILLCACIPKIKVEKRRLLYYGVVLFK